MSSTRRKIRPVDEDGSASISVRIKIHYLKARRAMKFKDLQSFNRHNGEIARLKALLRARKNCAESQKVRMSTIC